MITESFSFLDEIPDKVYQRLITHQYRANLNDSNEHSLQQRVLGFLAVRESLLRGDIPDFSTLLLWLDNNTADFVSDKLTQRSLLKNTCNNTSYTDDVLFNVLDWLDDLNTNPDDFVHQKETQKLNETASITFDATKNADDSYLSASDKNIHKNINWKKNQDLLQHINAGFALERNLGWDLTEGIHSETDINTLLEFYDMAKKSKRIQSVIRMIGRGKKIKLDQKSITGLNQAERESANFDNALPDDRAVNSVTGLCRGDDVTRMLSSEMALLGHAKFKILWHARRAEQQLLSYHYQGLLSEHVPNIQKQSLDEQKAKISVKNAGPMILCVDTSASMRGRPELLSKSIALEAMRISHLYKRPCFLFFFSGPNELIQLDLNLQQDGDFKKAWKGILKFLSLSFNGGTDINNVMLEALKILMQKRWHNADIVIISDGLFKVENSLLEKINTNKKFSRIFGIQLGKWQSQSLSILCHTVFDLSDVN